MGLQPRSVLLRIDGKIWSFLMGFSIEKAVVLLGNGLAFTLPAACL